MHFIPKVAQIPEINMGENKKRNKAEEIIIRQFRVIYERYVTKVIGPFFTIIGALCRQIKLERYIIYNWIEHDFQ
jgi:hypothetical protein